MAYIITNPSGNKCGVTEKAYYELVSKEGYTGEILEEKSNSNAYTISELRELKPTMEDEEWEEFTKEDNRKSISQL
jgi:hypothetical protein